MSNDIEYEIVQDDMLVASACGDNALNEIKHYAAQYEQDGPIKVYELTRREIDLAAPSVASGAQEERVARAICVACEENPDHKGDARGNEFRWQDYLGPARAAIAAQAKPITIPPIPQMDGLQDVPYALNTPSDWDADYANTWSSLQVAERNKMQWRAHALELRAILANSAPNKALVEALQELAKHGEYGTATELVARAALNAAGVEGV